MWLTVQISLRAMLIIEADVDFSELIQSRRAADIDIDF